MQRRVLSSLASIPLRRGNSSIVIGLRRSHPLYLSLTQPRRFLSGTAKQEGGGSGGEGKKDAGEGQGAENFDEPLVARVSRAMWQTIKICFGTLIAGGVLYCGYSIVLVLVPVGSSSNRIMRKASDILEHDPEITKYFGSVKTFGIGAGEGRRYYVPEYKYDDILTGVGWVERFTSALCLRPPHCLPLHSTPR